MGAQRSRSGLSLLTLFLLATSSPGQDLDKVQLSVEAAYLYHFTRFVEWPPTDGPLTVCVVGRDPFGATLDLAMRDKRAGGRPLTVRRLGGPGEARACNVAFLPAGDEAQLGELTDAVEGSPVLLVGDAPEFARRGGMIGFYRDQDRVRFEINPAAAEAAGLRISSRLLGLSTVVADERATR
jgi:hypothetical protein